MQTEVGAVLDGRVTGITNFGAFVALPGGKSGLVHISEVANTYVRDIHDFLSEQQEVKVKVLSISPQGKISLSIKQAVPPPPPRERRPERTERKGAPRASGAAGASGEYIPRGSGDPAFEDKLKRFMQESDGKMSGNKLFQQQRKGQRRRK